MKSKRQTDTDNKKNMEGANKKGSSFLICGSQKVCFQTVFSQAFF